jgi:hypothetical protein
MMMPCQVQQSASCVWLNVSRSTGCAWRNKKEQQQAYSLANRELSAGVALTGLGQVLGLVFLSLVAVAGIWLVLNDKSMEGLISLIAAIATLLTAFLKTRKPASEAT